MELTETLIDGAIDSITGFMVARAAKQYHEPITKMMERFLLSNTYKLLSDKDTGLYWDSLSETYAMLINEIEGRS
ncbi:MAG: hypothetical protein LBQ46_12230 [Treponema sp.]|nr:hypothetical protein [Treponema sp.]